MALLALWALVISTPVIGDVSCLIPQGVFDFNNQVKSVNDGYVGAGFKYTANLFQAMVEDKFRALYLQEIGVTDEAILAIKRSTSLTVDQKLSAIANIVRTAPVRKRVLGFTDYTGSYKDLYEANQSALKSVIAEVRAIKDAGLATSDAAEIDRRFTKIGLTVAERLKAFTNGTPLKPADLDKLAVRGLGPVKIAQLQGYFDELDKFDVDLSSEMTSTPKWLAKINRLSEISGGVIDGVQTVTSTLTIASGNYNISDVWNAVSGGVGVAVAFCSKPPSNLACRGGQRVAGPIAVLSGVRDNVENWTKLASLLDDSRDWQAAIADLRNANLNPLQMQQFYTDMANQYVVNYTAALYGAEKALAAKDVDQLMAWLKILGHIQDGARQLKDQDTMGYLSAGMAWPWDAWAPLLGYGVDPELVNKFDPIAYPSIEIEDLADIYLQKLRAEEFKSIEVALAPYKTQLQQEVNKALAAVTGKTMTTAVLLLPNRQTAAPDALDSSLMLEQGSSVRIRLASSDGTCISGLGGLSGTIKVVARQLSGTPCPESIGDGTCAFLLSALDADSTATFMPSTSGRYQVLALNDSTGRTLSLDFTSVWEPDASYGGTGTGTVGTSPLNDTGVTTFSNDTQNGLAVEPATHPGQDARFGRDAAAAAGQLTKVGAGSAGFDFTKISNSGAELPANAALGTGPNDWACTRDNVTGLIWEVKASSGVRSYSNTYSWYNSNVNTNGGAAGTGNGGSCNSSGRCDTEKFVADVNAMALCGASNWRMPTVSELLSIVDLGRGNPAIDVNWFPNTPSTMFWTGSPNATSSSTGWFVYFDYGGASDYNGAKSSAYIVRLVRPSR